jgi:hypothetical protein
MNYIRQAYLAKINYEDHNFVLFSIVLVLFYLCCGQKINMSSLYQKQIVPFNPVPSNLLPPSK